MRLLATLLAALTFCAAARSQGPDPVPKLLKQLKSKNEEKRADAFTALGDLGPKAEAAIPVLAALLTGVDEEQRILATLALGKIGKASLPAAVKLLDHEDETTRFYAVWTLALLGKDAQAQVPRLLKMLAADEDEDVRIKTIYALARIAPESREVLAAVAKRATHDQTPAAERDAAIDELRRFGAAGLDPLVQILAAENKKLGETVQFDGIGVLNNPLGSARMTRAIESVNDLFETNRNDAFARTALRHVPDLLTHLPGPNPFLPQFDDKLTGFLAKHGEKFLPVLEKKLSDRKSEAFHVTLMHLGQIASRLDIQKENPALLKKVLALLVPYFKDADPETRQMAIICAPWTEDTREALESLLYDANYIVRLHAIMRITLTGHDPTPKVQEKLRAAKGEARIRLAVRLHGIVDIGEDAGLVASALKHKDVALRHEAAYAMAQVTRFGSDLTVKHRTQIIDVLMNSLKSPVEERRLEAITGLLPWKDHLRRERIPALLDRLDDKSPAVQSSLLQIIGAHDYGADARATLPKLLPILDDAEVHRRYFAVFLLAPLHQQAVPYLVRLAEKDPSPRVWQQACKQLGALRPPTAEVRAALLRVAEQPERWEAACEALLALDGESGFAAVLGLHLKRDERLRKALTYADEVRQSRGKLTDALLKDLQAGDKLRRREAAYALHALVLMTPLTQQIDLSQRIVDCMPGILTQVGAELKAKDAKVRIDAAATFFDICRLEASLLPAMVPSLNIMLGHQSDPKAQKLFADRILLRERFEVLAMSARLDPDLQVRRLARTAQALTHMDPGPQGFDLLPPLPAVHPGSLTLPLLPMSIGPSRFGLAVPLSKLLGPPV